MFRCSWKTYYKLLQFHRECKRSKIVQTSLLSTKDSWFFRPVRDDEIGVFKGQTVQVLDVDSQRGGYLVRPQDHNDSSGTVGGGSTGDQSAKSSFSSTVPSGWVPTYVLNLLTTGPGHHRKPAWTFRKFRKPSFNRTKGDKTAESVSSNEAPKFVPEPPSQPRVEDLRGSSVVLRWDHELSYEHATNHHSYTVEACRLRSPESWTVRVLPNLSTFRELARQC